MASRRFFLALPLLALAGCLPEASLDTDIQKASYAIGYDMGSQFNVGMLRIPFSLCEHKMSRPRRLCRRLRQNRRSVATPTAHTSYPPSYSTI